MTNRAELEAALRSPQGMTYDNLVVYADQLQAEGDLRGELIALDLVAPANRYADGARSWRERRSAVLAEWLGGRLADEIAGDIDLGFIKQLDQTASIDLLRSPVVDYLRAFVVDAAGASATEITARLRALAERPRPWLQRLEIVAPAWAAMPLVDAELAEALAEALPHLAHVAFSGHQIVARFAHPTLRSLDLREAAALVEIGAFPAVVQLALAAPIELPPDAFPALRILDLARGVEAQVALFDAIRLDDALRARIEILDLPALHSHDAVEAANRLLDALPKLRSVRLARTYGGALFGADLAKRVPPVEIPLPYPWPAPASLKAYSSLVVRLPEEPFDDIVALPPILAYLERHFDGFAPEARDAWTRIWEAVRPIAFAPYEDYDPDDPEAAPLLEPLPVAPVTVAILATAIAACEGLEAPSWRKLVAHFRDTVRGLTPETEVPMSIYR